MKITISVAGETLTAQLDDKATARDFLARLPLTLDFEDFHATEKIAYLPEALSTAGGPEGFAPSLGSIAYYAPWGNIAIFYKDAGCAKSSYGIGRVISGLEVLKKHPGFTATIERVAD